MGSPKPMKEMEFDLLSPSCCSLFSNQVYIPHSTRKYSIVRRPYGLQFTYRTCREQEFFSQIYSENRFNEFGN